MPGARYMVMISWGQVCGLLERFSKRLVFRIPRIAASCYGSGGSTEVSLDPTAGIIHFEKRCRQGLLNPTDPHCDVITGRDVVILGSLARTEVYRLRQLLAKAPPA
jgi:hypothetical protein